MPQPHTLSLKRRRKEDEVSQKHSWSRGNKATDKTRSLSVPTSQKETVGITKARSLPCYPSRAPFPSPTTSSLMSISTPPSHVHFFPSPPLQRKKKKKKLFPGLDTKWTEKNLKMHLSNQKKFLLGLFFKMTTVDGKSLEDPGTFPNAAGVTTCLRNTRGYPMVVDYLVGWSSCCIETGLH